MILLYALVVTLMLLLMRPRLIAYNMSSDQVRSVVKDVIGQLDPQARWAGDCVIAPGLGLQLALEAYPGIRNVTLASVGPDQDLDGWHKLKLHLQSALAGTKQVPNLQGLSFVLLSAVLTAAVVYSLLTGRQEIAQSFREMLRM